VRPLQVSLEMISTKSLMKVFVSFLDEPEIDLVSGLYGAIKFRLQILNRPTEVGPTIVQRAAHHPDLPSSHCRGVVLQRCSRLCRNDHSELVFNLQRRIDIPGASARPECASDELSRKIRCPVIKDSGTPHSLW
jgi:hypothetical protein